MLLQGCHKGLGFKGPCTQIVYTLALKYLYRDYIKAKVYTTWVLGPLGISIETQQLETQEPFPEE